MKNKNGNQVNLSGEPDGSCLDINGWTAAIASIGNWIKSDPSAGHCPADLSPALRPLRPPVTG